MKSRIKNYLSVTKAQWNGLVVFILLIALILAAPYIYQYYFPPKAVDFKDIEQDIALLKQATGDDGEEVVTNTASQSSLFKFNPNNLTADKWQKLGLSDKQINSIKNYEAKGGSFKTKGDVKKMYALSPADYQRLAPYIDLPEGEAYSSNKLPPGQTIELNTADSAALTRIHGIGPAFAARIVAYRKRLGGFLHKEQLKEVYGIDAEKYGDIAGQVTVNASRISKININAVDVEELRKFPYLTYKQCNAIIQYRLQHGNYSSITDMQNIAILDDIILRKIEPYINFK